MTSSFDSMMLMLAIVTVCPFIAAAGGRGSFGWHVSGGCPVATARLRGLPCLQACSDTRLCHCELSARHRAWATTTECLLDAMLSNEDQADANDNDDDEDGSHAARLVIRE
jgi:hypothetical protein